MFTRHLVLGAALAMSMLPAGAEEAPDPAHEVGAVPVLWREPSCGYDKLGSVTATTGTEVSAQTADVAWVPPADYHVAFQRLGEAARARGGNAVVLRKHEATFFSKARSRSRRPVLVRLNGAVIRLPLRNCELEHVDPNVMLARAMSGQPFDVPTGLIDPPER